MTKLTKTTAHKIPPVVQMKDRKFTRFKSSEVSSVSSILPALLRYKKIEVESNDLDVFKIWPQIIGDEFKNSTKPLKLDKGVLTIEAVDAVIIQELSMRQSQIQKNLISLGFGGKVAKIKFVSGNPKNFKSS